MTAVNRIRLRNISVVDQIPQVWEFLHLCCSGVRIYISACRLQACRGSGPV